MQKYYWVFDATPSTEHLLDYNRIGIGLEDHSKEEEIGIFDELDLDFFEEYLLYVYIVIVILVLLILGCIVFSCAQAKKKKKLDRMNPELLNDEAHRLMNNFKAGIEKKAEKDRKKAMKKWQKKNPGLNLNESILSSNQMSQSQGSMAYNGRATDMSAAGHGLNSSNYYAESNQNIY